MGAVLGTLRTLAHRGIAPVEALRGAGYGAVEGAVEAGRDPAEAAAQALAAARTAASELGVSAEEAASALAAGVLDAAAASGAEALRAVREALSGRACARDRALLGSGRSPWALNSAKGRRSHSSGVPGSPGAVLRPCAYGVQWAAQMRGGAHDR